MMSWMMKKICELLVEGQTLSRPESNFSMPAGGWTCQRNHEQTLGEGRNFNSGTFCFLHQKEDTAAGQGSQVYGKGGEHRSTHRSNWGLQPWLLLVVSRQESTA